MLDSLNGSGTRGDPYKITNSLEFKSINEDPSAFYELSNDIKFENGVSPIGQFSGVFDGQGHEIQGNNTTIKGGLFRITTEDAIIRNVGLIDTQIGNRDNNDYYTGGLVDKNYGEISDAYYTGAVNGRVRTGGLVGFNRGEISNSYSTETVNGNFNTGGLVSWSKGEISNAYSTGTVKGERRNGGLVGLNNGSVNFCWATLENDCSLIGVNISDDNRAVFGFEKCNGLSLEGTDVRLDANDWSMSYDLDSQTLGLVHNHKTYTCQNVSLVKAQELVEGFGQYVVEVSNNFKASVVSNI